MTVRIGIDYPGCSDVGENVANPCTVVHAVRAAHTRPDADIATTCDASACATANSGVKVATRVSQQRETTKRIIFGPVHVVKQRKDPEGVVVGGHAVSA